MTQFNESDHPRISNGTFTDKPQSAPEVTPLGERPVFTIRAENGNEYVTAAGSADEALRQYLSGLDPNEEGTYPAAITQEGDEAGVVVFTNMYGDAKTLEELRHAHSSLDGWEAKIEPLVDVPELHEGTAVLDSIREGLADGTHRVSLVELARAEDGNLNLEITVEDNLLWNDLFTEAELDEHSDLVKEVYQEWFNAGLDGDEWDAQSVTLNVPIKDGEHTETLLFSKGYGAHAKFLNETDPGTFGSPYIGAEIRKRIDERIAARKEAASV